MSGSFQAPGARDARVLPILIEIGQHRRPAVLDVVGGAPEIPDGRRPLPRLIRAPFTNAQHDRAPGPSEGVAELRVLHPCDEALCVAPVFLHVIHAPRGVGARILLFVAEGSGTSLAGLGPGVGVDTEREPFAVDVVGERLDPVREARAVGDDDAARVARRLPAVVDDDVAIACVAHPTGRDRVGFLLDEPLAHVTAEVIPAVPAHRRRAGKPVVEFRAA